MKGARTISAAQTGRRACEYVNEYGSSTCLRNRSLGIASGASWQPIACMGLDPVDTFTVYQKLMKITLSGV